MSILAALLAVAAQPQEYAWTYQLSAGETSNLSCAAAFSGPIENSRPSAWILGYWSGLNVGAHANSGRGVDTAGILGEVKLDCDQHPSTNLVQSVWGTWARLRKAPQ